MRLLALHGRGSGPKSVLEYLPDTVTADAPHMDAAWLARPFAEQVGDVGGWLDRADVAVGHSWGAWLLLAAAVERVERGLDLPNVVLLAPLLGTGRHPGGAPLGFIPPRSRRLAAALSPPDAKMSTLPAESVTIIHGEDDEQVPIENVRDAVGDRYRLLTVPGGHRLDHPEARQTVRAELVRVLSRSQEDRTPGSGS